MNKTQSPVKATDLRQVVATTKITLQDCGNSPRANYGFKSDDPDMNFHRYMKKAKQASR